MAVETVLSDPAALDKGTRLVCERCGSEIEFVNPCPQGGAGQVFRCCGGPMRASTGREINLGVE
jgi:hypothetical protein